MKAFVIGAGRVGALVAKKLHNLEFDVTIIDKDPNALTNPVLEGCERLFRDYAFGFISNTYDYVVNCGPWQGNSNAMKVAINANAHYFDVSESAGAITTAQNYATSKDCSTALVPACGFAPGFVSIMANSMAARWVSVDRILIYVGSLPLYVPANRIKHEITFSVEGLVNEYTSGTDVLVGGSIRRAKPLGGVEDVTIGSQEFEAFVTAGGLGTLTQTWQGRADTVMYKTVRYKGHLHSLGALMDLVKDKDGLLDAFRNVPKVHPGDDMVVAQIRVEGQWGKDLWERSYIARKGDVLAISNLTAASVCAMVELHVGGKIAQKGFVAQESAGIDDFLDTESGKEFC